MCVQKCKDLVSEGRVYGHAWGEDMLNVAVLSLPLRARERERASEREKERERDDTTPCRMARVTLHTGLFPQREVESNVARQSRWAA